MNLKLMLLTVRTSEKLPTVFGVSAMLEKRLRESEDSEARSSSIKLRELEDILTRKSTNGETSLLHYVVHILEKNSASGDSTLFDELAPVEGAKEGNESITE